MSERGGEAPAVNDLSHEAQDPTTSGERLRELMLLASNSHGLAASERATLRALLVRNPALPLDLLDACLVNEVDAWFNPSVPLVLMTRPLPHYHEAARLLLAVFAPERSLSLRTLVRLWGERSFSFGRPEQEARARAFAGCLASLFGLPWPDEISATAHADLLREAQDPTTSPDRLRAIHATAERGVLDAIVRNPTLPLDLVRAELLLARRSNLGIWHNPSVPLLLRSEPSSPYEARAYRDLRGLYDALVSRSVGPIGTLPELVHTWGERRMEFRDGQDKEGLRALAFAHHLAGLFDLPWPKVGW